MWTAELVGGPCHGQEVRIIAAYLELAVPVQRAVGSPIFAGLYRLAHKEITPGTHRYFGYDFRRLTWQERLLFEGGAHMLGSTASEDRAGDAATSRLAVGSTATHRSAT